MIFEKTNQLLIWDAVSCIRDFKNVLSSFYKTHLYVSIEDALKSNKDGNHDYVMVKINEPYLRITDWYG